MMVFRSCAQLQYSLLVTKLQNDTKSLKSLHSLFARITLDS